MSNLDFVFKPKAVAVVGASTKIGAVGDGVLKNLQAGFSGNIYPVNPKADSINGLKCYPNLSAIGAPVDLMIIIVPAVVVPAVLEEGGSLGIKGAIVISAGFKEVGRIDLENQLKDISAKYDIALIGPNCLGIINPSLKLNASFAPLMPAEGQVAFISQSGAICSAVIDCACDMGIGFSKFMSVGNKAVVEEAEIFEYLYHDTETQVIALYAEQLSHPEILMPLVKKIGHGATAKPIIVLKSGRTSAGAGASASHTGALAGNDAAYNALFRQSGIIRADSVEEMFDYIKIFSTNKLAPAGQLAVITNAGGPGVLAIDATVENGLNVSKLAAATTAALQATLPAAANIHNPIDVLGDALADRYQKALEIVLADPSVETVAVILTPQTMTEIDATAQAIVLAKQKYSKPIAACFMGEELVASGLKILRDNQVAAYSYPEEAIIALDVFNNFYMASQRPEEGVVIFDDVDKEAVAKIFSAAKARGQSAFPESEALAIFAAYKFPILVSHVATTAAEATQIAQAFGQPVALKIVSEDILHKSDAGGVMLAIDPSEAGEKFTELMTRVAHNKPEAKLEGVLLEDMVSENKIELILGSVKDPSLGSTIMVGLGGIYVEVFKDVVFGLNPLTKSDAKLMLNSLKAKKILDGIRGAKPSDQDKVVECLLRLAQLLKDFPEIKELDINPLAVFEVGQGVKALDGRIIIA